MEYENAGITNILSRAKLEKKLPVHNNITGGNVFVITNLDKEVKFVEGPVGLYYHGTQHRAVGLCKKLKGNQEVYTQQKVAQAKVAQESQLMMENSLYQDMNNIVHGNLIHFFPVMIKDITAPEKIFGPNTVSLKDKKVIKLDNKAKT